MGRPQLAYSFTRPLTRPQGFLRQAKIIWVRLAPPPNLFLPVAFYLLESDKSPPLFYFTIYTISVVPCTLIETKQNYMHNLLVRDTILPFHYFPTVSISFNSRKKKLVTQNSHNVVLVPGAVVPQCTGNWMAASGIVILAWLAFNRGCRVLPPPSRQQL